jgi:pimeloyl-ACP methyl ester carboxylesterase
MAVLARRRRVHAMIAAIEAPTLIVQGTEDRLVPVAASRATVALRRDWGDAQAKSLGEFLRARLIDIPRSLLAE